MQDLEKKGPSIKPWKRLPDESIEDYVKRLHKQTDGYNTFQDIVKHQPQALSMLRRVIPELLEKVAQSQSK